MPSTTGTDCVVAGAAGAAGADGHIVSATTIPITATRLFESVTGIDPCSTSVFTLSGVRDRANLAWRRLN
jgi:hypothetical protein